MPSDSIEAVQAVYAAYDRRDLPAVFGLLHPEVEMVQTDLLPWGGRHVGLEGVRAFFGRLTAAVDSRVAIERLVEAGEAVVAVGRTRGQVRATGRPFDVAAVHVWTVRDGRIARFEAYIDTPAMLAALAP